MRPASYIVIAALAGFVGGNVLQLPELVDKVSGKFADQKTEPADFWSTPAIAGYGKIHFVNTPDYNPANTPGLSNKIVFQINRSEGISISQTSALSAWHASPTSITRPACR